MAEGSRTVYMMGNKIHGDHCIPIVSAGSLS